MAGTGDAAPVFIEVEGMDQAGIVYKLTSYLASRMVNIEHLSSTRRFSPESGAAIYHMTLEVTLPENVTLAASLDEGLGEIGGEAERGHRPSRAGNGSGGNRCFTKRAPWHTHLVANANSRLNSFYKP